MRDYAVNAVAALLIAASCASCSVHQDKSGCQYEIGIVPQENVLKFSSVYDSCECIPLTGIVMSNVRDVIITGSGLVVSGQSEKPGVFLFSKTGEYVSTIVRIGRGPGEIADIQSVKYNPYTSTIDVLGNIGMTVNKYDIRTFEFVGSFSVMETEIVSAKDFCPLDKDSYMFYKAESFLSDGDEYSVYLYDVRKQEISGRFIPMDKSLAEILSFGQTNNLFIKDGTVFYYAAFEKYIYRYESGVLAPWLEFAGNRYLFPQSLLSGNYRDVVDFVENACRPSSYIWAHVNLFAYKELLLSSYTYDNRVYANVIDLDRGESTSYSRIDDDMAFGISTDVVAGTYLLVGSDESCVTYVVEPFVVKTLVAGQDYCEQDESVMSNRDMLSSLGDDANPIVVVMH